MQFDNLKTDRDRKLKKNYGPEAKKFQIQLLATKKPFKELPTYLCKAPLA